jgi:para-aminobenzoate synthetase/4-amino-4-deoxychorismate lyase
MGGNQEVIMRNPEGGWRCFRSPVRLLVARRPAEVTPCLQAVDAAAADGLCVAGYVAYEAARGLDPAFRTRPPASGIPLAWFGVFECWDDIPDLPPTGDSYRTGDWQVSVSAAEYADAIRRIRRYIAAGDTYQVNYTIRLNAAFSGSPYALFLDLHAAQDANYSAFVDIGDHAFCSASPELFFKLDGDRIVSRPMKGTAPRGVTLDADATLARDLQASEKNRAEHVMIVDMVRNDLGRIADKGTVRVTSCFDVERYPTVIQMTSTVEARSSAGFADLWLALFPGASITGAPKVRTMEIIRQLENGPRGIYTGAIGYLLPGRHAGTAEFGVGGGIVWDSVDTMEYEECLTKALVLRPPVPSFDLVETMLWTPADGYFLLEKHLARAERSAGYFGFPFAREGIRSRLTEFAAGFDVTDQRVRLLIARDGSVRLESTYLQGTQSSEPFRVGLSRSPVSFRDPYLYHKTTHRETYRHARESRPDCDDVILFNERGEITEASTANVVIEREGHLVTPPVHSGLLAGVFREHLLDRDEIREGVLTPDDLSTAHRVFLINSVRRWLPVELVEG